MRNALAAVFVWYVASSLFDVHNRWLFVLFFVYITGISSVVYVYLLLIKKPVLNGIIRRIATISLLTGIMNAMAIPVLSVFTALWGSRQFHFVPEVALNNFQLGTLIGFGLGAGIELAEYLLTLKSFREFFEGRKSS